MSENAAHLMAVVWRIYGEVSRRRRVRARWRGSNSSRTQRVGAGGKAVIIGVLRGASVDSAAFSATAIPVLFPCMVRAEKGNPEAMMNVACEAVKLSLNLL